MESKWFYIKHCGNLNNIGNVFGMMPHPERTYYKHQHPDWTNTKLNSNLGDGKDIFESILDYICKRF